MFWLRREERGMHGMLTRLIMSSLFARCSVYICTYYTLHNVCTYYTLHNVCMYVSIHMHVYVHVYCKLLFVRMNIVVQ